MKKIINELKIDNNIEINYLMNGKTGFTSKNYFENQNKINNKYNFKKKYENIDKKILVNNTKPLKGKKLLGRKKKDSNEKGFHNRNTEDNMTRKCKHLILENTLIY